MLTFWADSTGVAIYIVAGTVSSASDIICFDVELVGGDVALFEELSFIEGSFRLFLYLYLRIIQRKRILSRIDFQFLFIITNRRLNRASKLFLDLFYSTHFIAAYCIWPLLVHVLDGMVFNLLSDGLLLTINCFNWYSQVVVVHIGFLLACFMHQLTLFIRLLLYRRMPIFTHTTRKMRLLLDFLLGWAEVILAIAADKAEFCIYAVFLIACYFVADFHILLSILSLAQGFDFVIDQMVLIFGLFLRMYDFRIIFCLRRPNTVLYQLYNLRFRLIFGRIWLFYLSIHQGIFALGLERILRIRRAVHSIGFFFFNFFYWVEISIFVDFFIIFKVVIYFFGLALLLKMDQQCLRLLNVLFIGVGFRKVDRLAPLFILLTLANWAVFIQLAGEALGLAAEVTDRSRILIDFILLVVLILVIILLLRLFLLILDHLVKWGQFILLNWFLRWRIRLNLLQVNFMIRMFNELFSHGRIFSHGRACFNVLEMTLAYLFSRYLFLRVSWLPGYLTWILQFFQKFVVLFLWRVLLEAVLVIYQTFWAGFFTV